MRKTIQTKPLPKLSMNSPEEILAAIPYLVGFHVRESVVVLVLTGPRVVLTARLDAVAYDPVLDRFDQETTAALAARVCVAIDTNHGDGLVLVGYHDSVPAMRELLRRLACEGAERITLGGQGLIDVLLVSGERFYELLSCEPDAHLGFALAGDSVPTAAQAVYFGLNALPDRHALEQAVVLPTPEQAKPLEAIFENEEMMIAGLGEAERAELCDDLLDAATRMKGQPRAEPIGEADELVAREYVRLAILMGYIEVRDAVLMQTHVGNAARRVEVWSQVVRHSIAGFASGPLGVLAMTAWLSGNGALQVICIQRLREVAPSYRLLRILEQINEAALPPSCWGPADAGMGR